MYYSNEFIDECIKNVSIDPNMYANIQAHNVAKMLKSNRNYYKLFGVYWWAVKDALRKYVYNGEWFCGKQDDPLMKERASHGSEFRTMVAAMCHYNEKFFEKPISLCEWYDKNGDIHAYTLDDPDSSLKKGEIYV